MASLVPGEPLRILLVTSRQVTRDAVVTALAQGVGDHRLFWVSQPDLASVRAQDLTPHVMMVDADMPEVALRDLILDLAASAPEAAVVALVPISDMAAARTAVLAGARAFISQPVKGDEVINTLRQVVTRRAPTAPQPDLGVPLGHVIVFCAPKGGTGRTTLAINTSICLREHTKQGLALVDADYAAPAIDVALNLHHSRDITDLLPKLTRLDHDLVASVLATHSTGIRTLLAPSPEHLGSPVSLPQVQVVTAYLRRMFPWVVVDLGLPLDETAFAFLDMADRVVMSVLPEMVGLRNARLMLGQLDNRNYPPGKVWPLLNRDGLPGGIKAQDLARWLGRIPRFLIPNDQALATESINRGRPMVIMHRRTRLAKAYRDFAAQITADMLPKGGAAVAEEQDDLASEEIAPTPVPARPARDLTAPGERSLRPRRAPEPAEGAAPAPTTPQQSDVTRPATQVRPVHPAQAAPPADRGPISPEQFRQQVGREDAAASGVFKVASQGLSALGAAAQAAMAQRREAARVAAEAREQERQEKEAKAAEERARAAEEKAAAAAAKERERQEKEAKAAAERAKAAEAQAVAAAAKERERQEKEAKAAEEKAAAAAREQERQRRETRDAQERGRAAALEQERLARAREVERLLAEVAAAEELLRARERESQEREAQEAAAFGAELPEIEAEAAEDWPPMEAAAFDAEAEMGSGEEEQVGFIEEEVPEAEEMDEEELAEARELERLEIEAKAAEEQARAAAERAREAAGRIAAAARERKRQEAEARAEAAEQARVAAALEEERRELEVMAAAEQARAAAALERERQEEEERAAEEQVRIAAGFERGRLEEVESDAEAQARIAAAFEAALAATPHSELPPLELSEVDELEEFEQPGYEDVATAGFEIYGEPIGAAAFSEVEAPAEFDRPGFEDEATARFNVYAESLDEESDEEFEEEFEEEAPEIVAEADEELWPDTEADLAWAAALRAHEERQAALAKAEAVPDEEDPFAAFRPVEEEPPAPVTVRTTSDDDDWQAALAAFKARQEALAPSEPDDAELEEEEPLGRMTFEEPAPEPFPSTPPPPPPTPARRPALRFGVEPARPVEPPAQRPAVPFQPLPQAGKGSRASAPKPAQPALATPEPARATTARPDSRRVQLPVSVPEKRPGLGYQPLPPAKRSERGRMMPPASVGRDAPARRVLGIFTVEGLKRIANLLGIALVVCGILLAVIVPLLTIRQLVTGGSGGTPATATLVPAAISSPTVTTATATPTPVEVAALAMNSEVSLRTDDTTPGLPDTPAPAATDAPTEMPAPSATPVPTNTQVPADTPTPEPTATATAEPTATATSEPTATPTPRPTPTRTPTRKAAGAVLPPLTSPANNEVRTGEVTFKWRPTVKLPAGARYEVVWWNMTEPASSARGVAPPTTATQQVVNIDALAGSGQMWLNQFYWGVLVVRENPYQRLTQPRNSSARVLVYGGGIKH